MTRTLRLDAELSNALAAAAEREGVNPSFIVNQALRRAVEWEAYAQKFGFVSVPASLLHRVMDQLSDLQARDLGRWVGANHVREFLTFWFKEVTPRTLVQGYPRLASKYTHAFEYEEHSEGPRWVLVFKHGGGPNWSVYYEELLRSVFREILQREVEIETTERQVVVRLNLG